MNLDSPYWFELAVVFGLSALGGIVFSGFAQHESRWRRVTKLVVGAGVAVGVSAGFGREGFWALLGVVAVAVLLLHGWWLPRRGVNGITAEPRARYFELRGWKAK